jgi:hypothetical protein
VQHFVPDGRSSPSNVTNADPTSSCITYPTNECGHPHQLMLNARWLMRVGWCGIEPHVGSLRRIR